MRVVLFCSVCILVFFLVFNSLPFFLQSIICLFLLLFGLFFSFRR